jgi:hypothetical protein
MKNTWIVNMTCIVTKEVICEGCTEEDARNNPFDYAVTEEETNQISLEVNSVEPNE